MMKNKNICKFIQPSAFNKLETHQFVFETNAEVIRESAKLPFNRLILITSGTGEFSFDGNTVSFNPGNLIFGFKDESAYALFENTCEYLYISFSGERGEALFKRFGINKSNRIFSSFESLIPFWQESLSRSSQLNIDLTSEGVLLYTFSKLNSSNVSQNNLISRIIEISEDCFSDPGLSLASISQELCYNSKYISHLFRTKTGTGYTEYLKTLRINHAVALLDYGIDSIKNVALLSGFTDPLYFSTVFKKSVGISPTEYINRKK